MSMMMDVARNVFAKIQNSELVRQATAEVEAERDAKRASLVDQRAQIEKEALAAIEVARKKVAAIEPRHAKSKAAFEAIDKELREAKREERNITMAMDGQRDRMGRELLDLRPQCIAEFLDAIDSELNRLRVGAPMDTNQLVLLRDTMRRVKRTIASNRPSIHARILAVTALRRGVSEWHLTAKSDAELRADFDAAWVDLPHDLTMVDLVAEVA